MTPLTIFETKGLSDQEFLVECFELDMDYQSYVVSAELCQRPILPQPEYHGLWVNWFLKGKRDAS